MISRTRTVLLTVGLALGLEAQCSPAAPTVDLTLTGALRYRYIGPVGNRVASVAGVPGDFDTYNAGAASGGSGTS